jgi:hypothetical protein
MLWLEKPFGVERPTVFVYSSDDIHEVRVSGQPVSQKLPWVTESTRGPFTEIGIKEIRFPNLGEFRYSIFMPIESGYSRSLSPSRVSYTAATVAFYFMGAVTTAIQLAAWNWDFPTVASRTTWRISGIGGLVGLLVPLLGYVGSDFHRTGNTVSTDPIIQAMEYTKRRTMRMLGHITAALSSVCIIFYIVSCTILFILSLYCISSQPASAYENIDWTKYLPHFS